ncbi:class I SAM-dependent methyltransferase [Rubrobacter marinus]|uniref:class I SAM-dependent methyltransferase n=1 Tax=Rubrobacter marinus TaxID=2653852 RepID=UPI00140A3C06|nr:methyltransferase domain-containing protein [Rubrobacter marinus]
MEGADRAREVRERQRADWGAVAGGWQRHREKMSAPMSAITERMVEALGVGPGDRVLDLACGVGDPAFTLSRLVGPEGFVLGLDLSPEMARAARSWAEEHGIGNVGFREIPTELDLGVEPESFDAATCRLGLMFVPDPVAALRELLVALVPGGRISVSAWGRPERNPNFSLPMEVIARHAELPQDGPGLFALPTPSVLGAVLEAAGFTGVEASAFETPVVKAKDAESYWYGLTAMAGPLVSILAPLDEERRRAVRSEVVEEISALFPGGPVEMSGEVVVASGEKGS